MTLTSTYTDNVPATNALKIFIALFNSSQTIASKPGSVSNTGLTLATNYIVSTPQEITFGSAVGAIISLKRNGSQVHGQGSDFVTVTWEPPPTTTLSSPTGDLRAGQSTRLTATVTDIPVLVNRTRPAQSRQLTDVSLDFLITRSGGDTDQVSGIAGVLRLQPLHRLFKLTGWATRSLEACMLHAALSCCTCEQAGTPRRSSLSVVCWCCCCSAAADLNNPGFYADYTWPAPGSYIVTTETRLSGVKGVATSTNSLNLNVLAATPVDFTRIFLFARKADASYSDRTHLKAAVLDTAGQPLPGVSVTFTLVHACASKQLEYMPCVDTQQAVTDSDGEAVISCRGPTDEDAYAIARARNNRGTLISSRRMSLWPEDHDGYAAAQAVP